MDPVTRTEFRAGMNGMQGRMDGLQAQMGGLENRLGGLENRLGGLEGRMGDLEGRMGCLEGGLQELRGVTHKLAVEQARMRQELSTRFATKDDFQTVRDDIERLRLTVLDSAEKGRAYFEKALSHGGILQDHEARLKGHEKRIVRLERRPD